MSLKQVLAHTTNSILIANVWSVDSVFNAQIISKLNASFAILYEFIYF